MFDKKPEAPIQPMIMNMKTGQDGINLIEELDIPFQLTNFRR